MKFKKLLTTLILATTISTVALGQSTQAAMINPSYDITMTNSIYYPGFAKDDPMLLVQNFPDPFDGTVEQEVSFLQFKTASMSELLNGSHTINSIKLKLFYIDHQSSTYPTLSIIQNDNWEEIGFSTYTDLAPSLDNIWNIASNSIIDDSTEQSMTYDLLMNDIIAEMNADAILSFALKYNESNEIMDTSFFTKDDGEFAPQFIVNATPIDNSNPAAPVPEPSSMILGSLGLAFMQGRKFIDKVFKK